MPIYEYQAAKQNEACRFCTDPFEVLQGLNEEPLSTCPECGREVVRIISWCRAAVMEASEEDVRVSRTIRDYESAGMWSHAAELADKHAEKTKDTGLKTRALENYRKAGYNLDSTLKSTT